MDIVNDIISYLQNIQDNLVGLILPVLITALVSLVTLITNAIMQIVLQNGKYNSDQYTIMQEFYPEFKAHLLGLSVVLQELKRTSICKDLKSAVDKYLEYKRDDENYRINHPDEIQQIDTFNTLMDTLLTKLVNMNNYLLTCKIPRSPIMHPILRVNVCKMLVVSQSYSFLFCEYSNNSITGDTLKAELTNLKKNWKMKVDYDTAKKYILLLDKWLMKY